MENHFYRRRKPHRQTSGEQYLKIIREESIDDMSYNTKDTNDWSQSDVKNILNRQYYNGEDINYTYKEGTLLIVSEVSLNEKSRSMNI